MTVTTRPEPAARAAPPASPGVGVTGHRGTAALTLGLALIAAAALALALRAPLATTVLGLIAFGVLHNVLELRYVAGRFAHVLGGRFLALLVALVTGIVLCRLAALVVGPPARYAEIVVGYAVLGVACARGLRGVRLTVATAALVAATAASVRWPAYHFVVLAHLHNVVPLVFLWEWARRLPTAAARAGFRLVQVGWVLVVPALLLAGVADAVTGPVASQVAAFAGDPARIVAASAPPAAADSQLGVRFLVVFAFLQTMHYVVWVGFLPRFAPDASAAFAARVPWLTGRRVWAIGAAGGLVLAAFFAIDYAAGRSLYSAFASYHAYLEFPVLLALLLTPAVNAAGVAGVPSTKE
jgi:hypothetical protein